MSIKFHCSVCQKTHDVKEDYAGKRARCSCGAVMTVPQPGAEPEPPIQRDQETAVTGTAAVIRFLCSECGYQSDIPVSFRGKTVACPGCRAAVVVATSTAAPSAATGLDQLQDPGFFQKIRKRGSSLARKLIKKGQDAYESALQQAYASESTELISIEDSLVLGRDPNVCQYTLGHAQVSRRHLQIQRSSPSFLVTDLGSSNGTYLNGSRIKGTTNLAPGDMLNVGPYSFTFDGQFLVTASRANNAEIICSGLSRDVTDRTTGKPIRILNDVSLLLKPCEFTVIIGPSGGGKSTLLNALSARQPATSGVVLFNGQNLYTHFDALKKNMALVPQKDVLHSELRLQNALLYTAKLRLPPDLGESGYLAVVNEYLETVDLGERSSTSIKNLSGGQVKRASLANEIISEPNLLFVDEATSGLDEHTDGEIMQIFRKIAEGGKTVICITHNLTNVEKSCHKVVILAPGGYLAFVGSPDEAKDYFNISSLGEVYNQLRDKPSQQWQSEFTATPTYQQMHEEVQTRVDRSKDDVESRQRQPFSQIAAIFIRQLILLCRRGLEIQLSDTKSLLMMGVQCLFIGFLICVLFGQIPDGLLANFGRFGRGPFSARVLFLLTISGFWFGCNNAAKEIVKEKEIYERERDVCLNVISYYAAKFLLLTVITAAQILVLLFIVRVFTGLPGLFIQQLLSLTLIGICGVATGLLISTISTNTDMAVTLVPVAIIPQVILAGVIWQVDHSAKLISELFISCYWGYGNVVSTVPAAADATGFGDWNYFSSGIVLMLHIGLLVFAANVVLYAVDKRLSLKGTGIDNWMNNARKVIHEAIDSVAPHQVSNTETVVTRIKPPPIPGPPNSADE